MTEASNFKPPMRETKYNRDWRCQITEPSYAYYDWRPTNPPKGATASARELNDLATNPYGNKFSKRR